MLPWQCESLRLHRVRVARRRPRYGSRCGFARDPRRRRAYPSIAETSDRGRSPRATRGCASVAPRLSARAARCGDNAVSEFLTAARACSIVRRGWFRARSMSAGVSQSSGTSDTQRRERLGDNRFHRLISPTPNSPAMWTGVAGAREMSTRRAGIGFGCSRPRHTSPDCPSTWQLSKRRLIRPRCAADRTPGPPPRRRRVTGSQTIRPRSPRQGRLRPEFPEFE